MQYSKIQAIQLPQNLQADSLLMPPLSEGEDEEEQKEEESKKAPSDDEAPKVEIVDSKTMELITEAASVNCEVCLKRETFIFHHSLNSIIKMGACKDCIKKTDRKQVVLIKTPTT